MPFTPFHMGPGIFVKALLQGSFSLMVFGWTQILMDIQPLVALLTGDPHLHGFTHTYLGATLIGAGGALTGKYAAEFSLRQMEQFHFLPISWPITIASAFIGSYSHVLLDSFMHSDLEPFAPFTSHNPFLGLVTVDAIYDLCRYSAFIGAGLYFLVSHWLAKPRPANRSDL